MLNMTIHHLRPSKSVNSRVWLRDAADDASEASGVIILAFYDNDKTQELRISYCNLNEQQLTWAAAKLDDYVTAIRQDDTDGSAS